MAFKRDHLRCKETNIRTVNNLRVASSGLSYQFWVIRVDLALLASGPFMLR